MARSAAPPGRWFRSLARTPPRLDGGVEKTVILPDWIWVFFLRALSFSSSCLTLASSSSAGVNRQPLRRRLKARHCPPEAWKGNCSQRVAEPSHRWCMFSCLHPYFVKHRRDVFNPLLSSNTRLSAFQTHVYLTILEFKWFKKKKLQNVRLPWDTELGVEWL